MKSEIKLGVNIDHAATLRQVRGGSTEYPDLLELTKLIKKAGGQQITIHLREDRRHIQDHDVKLLCRKSKLPINLEMAVSDDMYRIALENKPSWVCFVPEKRVELTTEGGLNVIKVFDHISRLTHGLQSKKIKVSFFIEPNLEQVRFSAEAQADAVEFHTGHWVSARGQKKDKIWEQLCEAAELAHELGLYVHAGHGLDYKHTQLIRKMPHLREVNIGHSIICYSIFDGIAHVIKKMRKQLNK